MSSLDIDIAADDVLLGTIEEWGPEFAVSFQIYVRDLPADNVKASLVRFQNTDSTFAGLTIRLLGNQLRIWSRENQDTNVNDAWSFDNVLSLNEWIDIKVEQVKVDAGVRE